MTAPRRLAAGARGSRLRVAIDTARRRGPSEDQLRALRAGLLGAGGAPASPTTARPNAGGWHVAVAKVAVGVTLAAGGAGLTARAWHRPATPATPAAQRPAPAPPPLIVGPSPPPPAASPPLSPPPAAGPLHVHRAGTGQAAQRRIASADRPPPPAGPPAADGAGELQLIEAAERALPANPELALSLLREHERRYPEGSLQQEREVIAVTALVAVGQRDRARDRADSFARQHPDSTYLPRLRRIISRGDGSRGDGAR